MKQYIFKKYNKYDYNIVTKIPKRVNFVVYPEPQQSSLALMVIKHICALLIFFFILINFFNEAV